MTYVSQTQRRSGRSAAEDDATLRHQITERLIMDQIIIDGSEDGVKDHG